MSAVKVKRVMERNAEYLVETIKTACQTRDVSEEHAVQYAAPIVNVDRNSFVRIEFAKLDAERIILALKINRASISNVLILALCQDSVVCVPSAVFTIMEFSAAVLRE